MKEGGRGRGRTQTKGMCGGEVRDGRGRRGMYSKGRREGEGELRVMRISIDKGRKRKGRQGKVR